MAWALPGSPASQLIIAPGRQPALQLHLRQSCLAWPARQICSSCIIRMLEPSSERVAASASYTPNYPTAQLLSLFLAPHYSLPCALKEGERSVFLATDTVTVFCRACGRPTFRAFRRQRQPLSCCLLCFHIVIKSPVQAGDTSCAPCQLVTATLRLGPCPQFT